MEKLIYIFTTVPIFIFLSIPVSLTLLGFFKKDKTNINFKVIQTWSFMSLVVSFAMSFAVYVMSSQGDLAFKSGKFFITERLALLFVLAQFISFLFMFGVFKFESIEKKVKALSGIFFSLAVLNYIIYVNEFVTVFVASGFLLLLDKKLRLKEKLGFLLSFVVSIILYFYSIWEMGSVQSYTFSDLRQFSLSGMIDSYTMTAFVGLFLVTLVAYPLYKFLSSKDWDWESVSNFFILDTFVIYIISYRLISSGFLESQTFMHSFGQWVLMLGMGLCLVFMAQGKNLNKILLSSVGFHLFFAVLSLTSMIDGYYLDFSIINYFVSMILFTTGLAYVLYYMKQAKGETVVPYDLISIKTNHENYFYSFVFGIVTLSALPPGPLFVNFFANLKELLGSGLYWSSLWSVLFFIIMMTVLIGLVKKASEFQEGKDVHFLWKREEDASLHFFECIFIPLLAILSYVFAFTNL